MLHNETHREAVFSDRISLSNRTDHEAVFSDRISLSNRTDREAVFSDRISLSILDMTEQEISKTFENLRFHIVFSRKRSVKRPKKMQPNVFLVI